MRKFGRISFPFQTGVIDVGAHAVRLDVFEVTAAGRVRLLETLSRTISLGNDVFRHGSVSPENLARLATVMSDFARKLSEYQVKVYRVAATSAIREAFNRELVINRVRNDSGLEIEVLDSQQEIRVLYLAMRESLSARMDFASLSGLFLVVGAGSLMVSYFSGGLMRFSEEIPLGTERLFDAYGRSPVSMEQLLETLNSQDIGRRLQESCGVDASQPPVLVALGASIRSFMTQVESGTECSESEFLELPAENVAAAARRLMALDGAAVAGELGVAQETGVSLWGCAGILSYFLENFSCTRVLSPGVTTRNALMLDLLRDMRGGKERDSFHDDLIAICDAVGNKYGYDPVHARQVSETCLLFFNKLRRYFDFAPRSRLLLEAAARLHDIGRFVDTRSHHKHSGYLIANMQLPGISPDELRVIAAVSRYHRKSGPKADHIEYMSLSAENKVTVLKLASILRVADALDCSRRRRFRKMKLVLRGHVLAIQVADSGDFRLERLYLNQKGNLFSEVFGLDLKIEEAPL